MIARDASTISILALLHGTARPLSQMPSSLYWMRCRVLINNSNATRRAFYIPYITAWQITDDDDIESLKICGMEENNTCDY